MRELSLNVMDVVQNSISAGAALIEIHQIQDTAAGSLVLVIEDNGCGMDGETVKKVTDPFYTTRTTRDVGLGVPLFKMACEMTGGAFSIHSRKGEGTRVEAAFQTRHIDMTPVGNMAETVALLINCNPDIDFLYHRAVDLHSYTLDTRQLREVLGEDVSLAEPDVVLWIKEYLAEHEQALSGK